MSTRHFNNLTPAEAERLALLSEECGEVVQIVGKILRHGWDSYHPDRPAGLTNRGMLQKEMGDVRAAMIILCEAGDTIKEQVHEYADEKLKKIGKYLHHQPKDFL